MPCPPIPRTQNQRPNIQNKKPKTQTQIPQFHQSTSQKKPIPPITLPQPLNHNQDPQKTKTQIPQFLQTPYDLSIPLPFICFRCNAMSDTFRKKISNPQSPSSNSSTQKFQNPNPPKPNFPNHPMICRSLPQIEIYLFAFQCNAMSFTLHT